MGVTPSSFVLGDPSCVFRRHSYFEIVRTSCTSRVVYVQCRVEEVSKPHNPKGSEVEGDLLEKRYCVSKVLEDKNKFLKKFLTRNQKSHLRKETYRSYIYQKRKSGGWYRYNKSDVTKKHVSRRRFENLVGLDRNLSFCNPYSIGLTQD